MKKILIFLLVFGIVIFSAMSAFAIDINALCIEAINAGDLTGSISGGTAHVDNDATMDFPVGLAVYKKFDEIIDNQQIFDYDTDVVGTGGETDLEVELPNCAYQIDLFCGDVLLSLNGFRYGDRKLDWEHVGGTNYCEPDNEIPEFTTIGAGLALAGAGLYMYRKRKK